MAFFASVTTSAGATWINLDYVLRVEEGQDESTLTMVRMTNGEVIKLNHEDGQRLVEQLLQCNGSRVEG